MLGWNSWLSDIPYSQFFASRIPGSSTGTRGRKKGRSIIYALDKPTSGKTCNVPSVGAVSLWRMLLGHSDSCLTTYLIASQPWKVLNAVA